MKKFILTTLTFLACGAAYALPVGNPADASLLCDGIFWEGYLGDPCDPCLTWSDAFSTRIGFYGDYVFNRHMEIDDHDRHKDIEHTSIYTNAFFVAGNFWDRVDVFVTLGTTNLDIVTNESAFDAQGQPSLGNGRFEIETETDFSWSVGIKGTIWNCGCTTLGAEAQYLATNPHITRLTQEDTYSVYPAGNIRARYREWQVGIGLAHRINMFVPYFAVKLSGSRLDMGDARISGFFFQSVPTIAYLNNLENKKLWGYAVGVSVVDCEKASFTVEGRFADEKAVYVNAQFRL